MESTQTQPISNQIASAKALEDPVQAYLALGRIDQVLTNQLLNLGTLPVKKQRFETLSKVFRVFRTKQINPDTNNEAQALKVYRGELNALQRQLEETFTEQDYCKEVTNVIEQIRLIQVEQKELAYLRSELTRLEHSDRSKILQKDLVNFTIHVGRLASIPLLLITPLSLPIKIGGLGLGALLDKELEFKDGDKYAAEVQGYQRSLKEFSDKQWQVYQENTLLSAVTEPTILQTTIEEMQAGIDSFSELPLPELAQLVLPNPKDESGKEKNITIGDVSALLNQYFISPMISGAKITGRYAKTGKAVDTSDVLQPINHLKFFKQIHQYRLALDAMEQRINVRLRDKEKILSDLI